MRNLMWAALATGFLLAGFEVAVASDTVRLGGPSAVQSGGDTELVHGRGYYGGGYGRGYYGGGYGRGYYGGGYGRSYYGGGYGRSYYGGGYGGYYRPSYYASYYQPSYYASYYQPYSYGSYYSPSSSNSCYYYPIAGEAVSPPATTLQSNYQVPQRQYAPPMPPALNGNGTFQYDGGPRSVIPMPAETNPANAPRRIIPTDGRLVSLPTETTGGTSPISTLPTTRAKTSAPRVSYPAYGE